jgi:hypothetical protein
MNDTPEWLRLLMERDPRAEDPAPQGAAHEERMLALLLVGMEDGAKVVELAEQLERG